LEYSKTDERQYIAIPLILRAGGVTAVTEQKQRRHSTSDLLDLY
jgi:hypothetical protein